MHNEINQSVNPCSKRMSFTSDTQLVNFLLHTHYVTMQIDLNKPVKRTVCVHCRISKVDRRIQWKLKAYSDLRICIIPYCICIK